MTIKIARILVTKVFSITGIVRYLFTILMFAVSVSANATIITLEPDDYGVGVPLENAYVTTAFVDGPLKNHSWNKALVARDGRDHDSSYVAPTGNLIFGAFPFIYYGDPDAGFLGFGIKFHQDVSNITLLANSIYPPGDLSAVWIAFDIDGKQIASGYAGGDRPASESFLIEIQSKGVRSLILGGDVATAAICFDYLKFELAEVVVSEPQSLFLLVIGLMMLMLRWKSRPLSNNFFKIQ